MIGIQLVIAETLLWTTGVGYCLHHEGTSCRVVVSCWPVHLCALSVFCGYVIRHLRQYLVMRGDYMHHIESKTAIVDTTLAPIPAVVERLPPAPQESSSTGRAFCNGWEVV